MDSLSQIVLGAATGELIAGRKLGNRALWLGAIGGTLPDLDVLGGFALEPLANLAFHRGITHSMLFWIIGAVIAGELTFKLARRSDLSRFAWYTFYFATFATHVLLDCFTMYGTQLYAPFADTRVAWSTIAVADPMYTLPFLMALIALSRQARGSSRRRFWHRFGWFWSLGYLALTVVNKGHVEEKLWAGLAGQNIPASRLVSNPTILNNVLWNAAAETEDAFWLAQYSIFDDGLPEWHRMDKDTAWFEAHAGDPVVERLSWFSDGFLYKSPVPASEGEWMLGDLRFGSFVARPGLGEDLIFRFLVAEAPDGLRFLSAEGGPKKGEEGDFFPLLWSRMWGRH